MLLFLFFFVYLFTLYSLGVALYEYLQSYCMYYKDLFNQFLIVEYLDFFSVLLLINLESRVSVPGHPI